MTKRARRFLVLGVVVVAGGLADFALTPRDHNAEIDEGLVVRVARGDLAVEVFDTGQVEPEDRVSIKSKVPGEVRAVRVREGDTVTKGQLLVEIDPTDLSREVDRAEAELATAGDTLAFATQSLARKKAASMERAVSLADVEAAEAEVDAARSKQRLARVALAAARDRLTYASIRAPIAGTVLQRSVEPGEVVVPGIEATFNEKPLLVIGDLASLHVRLELNQIDVARVALGQSAVIALDALPLRSWSGKVTKIAPAAVVSTMRKDREVFPVEVTIDSPDPAIRAGMTADVRIRVDERKDVLKLPIEAIVSKDGASRVIRVSSENGRKEAEERSVDTGMSNDHEIEVLSGLSEGEEVLVRPPAASKNEASI